MKDTVQGGIVFMSTIPSLSTPDLCGVVSGRVTSFDPAIDRARTTWTAGDFGRIATAYESGAAAFVDALDLIPGELVLDVACGTGNLTIPAAKKGAVVTGIDIAPNLIEAAKTIGAAASLAIRFDVGAAEALPYPDGAFDTVMSMFGVMFAGRPEAALAELLRVTRPGGRIALANWTPDGFVGSMLRAHTRFVPPPPGVPVALAWGDAELMKRRLDPHAKRIHSIRFTPRAIGFTFPQSPAGVVELFREFYGPTVRAFSALHAEERAQFGSVLRELWESRNHASSGSTVVSAEYLEIVIETA
jgi:SAM-dependent methyltransferase